MERFALVKLAESGNDLEISSTVVELDQIAQAAEDTDPATAFAARLKATLLTQVVIGIQTGNSWASVAVRTTEGDPSQRAAAFHGVLRLSNEVQVEDGFQTFEIIDGEEHRLTVFWAEGKDDWEARGGPAAESQAVIPLVSLAA